MAPSFSIAAWEIPWTEDPGRVVKRVTELSFQLFYYFLNLFFIFGLMTCGILLP